MRYVRLTQLNDLMYRLHPPVRPACTRAGWRCMEVGSLWLQAACKWMAVRIGASSRRGVAVLTCDQAERACGEAWLWLGAPSMSKIDSPSTQGELPSVACWPPSRPSRSWGQHQL